MHVEEQLGSFDAIGYARRLMGWTGRRLRWLLALCVLGSFATAATQVAQPMLVRSAVDGYMATSALPAEQRVRGVAMLAVAYACLLLLNFVVGYAVSYGLNVVGQNVVQRVRRDLMAHLHKLPMSYFDKNPVGRVVTRVANDTNALSELFTEVLATGVSDVLLVLGILIAIFHIDAGLALCVAALLPLLVLLTWWFKVVSQRLFRTSRVLLAGVNALFQENVQGIAVVKSFVAEKRMQERFHELNADTYRNGMQLVHVFGVFRPLVSAASTLGFAIVIWQGGARVLDATMTIGMVVAFLLYVRMLFSPIDELAEKLNLLQEALVASERIFRILDTPVEPPGGEHAARAQGHIVFEDVHFAYDPDKPVLQGVSFEIKPGERIALVGPSGSGKTSVISLLLGFYPLGPDSGRILIDGVPLQEWDVRRLRRQFGLVQQDLFLFGSDLAQNISLFEEVPEDLIQEALRVSQASRVVDKHSEGLQFKLNERGTTLSQGERQLLSFARALATDPPVLILDEATASVDSRTEQLIQEGLHGMLQGRTALIVAHRLSTVQEADRILVMKRGRISEQGSHAELLALDGLYAHLFREAAGREPDRQQSQET